MPSANQFTHRVDIELLKTYMVRGGQRERIKVYADQVRAKPGVCLLPDGENYVFMRDAGKLKKVSVRSLVYYVVHGTAPTFWPCGCKNKGCINPNHQSGDGL